MRSRMFTKKKLNSNIWLQLNDAGQPQYEIPIWICGEPRFISGISCATTCRDIIQALIDDELHGNSEEEGEADEEGGRERMGNWHTGGVVGNNKPSRQVDNDGQLVSHDDESDDDDESDVQRPSRRRYHQSGECNINIDRRKGKHIDTKLYTRPKHTPTNHPKTQFYRQWWWPYNLVSISGNSIFWKVIKRIVRVLRPLIMIARPLPHNDVSRGAIVCNWFLSLYFSLLYLDFTAASRDLSDYVITERWRDVEQPLSANTKILSIWTAWGSARNEVPIRYNDSRLLLLMHNCIVLGILYRESAA